MIVVLFLMDMPLFERLHAEGTISDTSLQNLQQHQQQPVISVHWELKTLLYLGVLLLSAGLGLLVYKNIDSIGHQAIVGFIALVTCGSFYYCFKNKLPFSARKVEAPNSFFDYVLLLACLTFITLVGYLQFEYNLFGIRFGLATFIPLVVMFFSAYYFDHLGILSLAITNLAAWAGIAVTPTKILQENDFNSDGIIFTGMLLGVSLIIAGIITKWKNLKPHFEFTYTNFGTHLLFISCLAGMFNFTRWNLAWFLILIVIGIYFYLKAVNEKSFYFLLLTTLYCYIGISYVVIHLLFFNGSSDFGGLYAALIYFIFSALGVAFFLTSLNKKLKA